MYRAYYKRRPIAAVCRYKLCSLDTMVIFYSDAAERSYGKREEDYKLPPIP